MTTTTENTATFKRSEEVDGTCLQGYITATREQLTTVFGEPGAGDDYKFFFHWGIEITESNGNKTIATIYDWKFDRKVDYTETVEWNIGGSSAEAVRLAAAILRQELQINVTGRTR
jgi:hypothetical protein